MSIVFQYYGDLLTDIKTRIRLAQTCAILAANSELIRLYWDIGELIEQRQKLQGWGAGVIPRLAKDLHNELPDIKGFSERNIKRMLGFYREYSDLNTIVPQAVAQLPNLKKVSKKVPQAVAQLRSSMDSILWTIPWGHHALLLEKIKHAEIRLWYMQQVVANGWSRNMLAFQIEGHAHQRQGKAVSNFSRILPPAQSDLALQTLKDPYLFGFLTLDESFHERELETGLVRHLEKFLLELGQGFAFVGRQYRVDVSGEDYYIDLLFYHLRLRAYVVIDLKTGSFKPEYAGKLNFYCNIVNDRLRHKNDQPTIGLILCQTKDNVLAEYSLRGIDKPIGISSYELTRALPKSLQSVLPTVEQLEAELESGAVGVQSPVKMKSSKSKSAPSRQKHEQK